MKVLPHFPKIVIVAFLAFHISACDQEEIDIYDLTGEWRVLSYKNSVLLVTKTEENTWSQYNNGDVTVRFMDTDLTSGEMSGIKVTNSFRGAYEIGDGGAITISDFSQTYEGEPEWGYLFSSITLAESYQVKNNRLIIYFNQEADNIVLERLSK